MNLAAVILAAGKGTRMKSDIPKVLHKVCGISMIGHVLRTTRGVGADRLITVVGFGGDMVARDVGSGVELVYQEEQLGTAHALLQVEPVLEGYSGDILVLSGDTPLLSGEILKSLIEQHRSSGLRATVLTALVEQPAGYGRIIRDQEGRVVRIVEQKDASPEELLVKEINTGIYCFNSRGLFADLHLVQPDNAQKEYYLPDLVRLFTSRGEVVGAIGGADPEEVMGINDRVQLAAAQASMQRDINRRLMLSGVSMLDPSSTYIDSGVSIGRDTVIFPQTMIQGETVIGECCRIGPSAHLVSARLKDNITVRQSIIEDSDVGSDSVIGPFAFVRPGCRIGCKVKVGDFVELKKVNIGDGSKVPHLSYVGDATLGQGVNIGAGTITCNYDGEKKWPTLIGDRAFIGSNTNLVAPVKIGAGAITGAGSTITRDVPDGALGVARDQQKIIPDWAGRKKIKNRDS